ncbi:alanine racemase [Miniphocaeibacter massiliensis]|uniref:alanine racemase n=1 Tax=Miniphocaeibacter massiliensis TaxID=2041841 RepID=UPI000C1C4F09|nr:alanine racemase [Miniphocaeibacter massiliensis]
MEIFKNKKRAWLEIDLSAIKHNIEHLSKNLDKNCNIMAVLKANAYNFDSVEIAKYLNKLNIYNFAVATIDEAIELRQANIIGEILVLGYTEFNDLYKLHMYDLTQTIVDISYFELLKKSKLRIKTHIAIDTGMHRLGVDYINKDELLEMFSCKNLTITGIYTHLCTSDGFSKEFENFVKYQLDNFNSVINFLEKNSIKIPKKHVQASTGVLNYPKFKSDFARLGVAIFGVLCSDKTLSNNSKELKEAISLKSKIISTKNVKKEDYIGYSQVYKAKKDMRIATVSIGYCDGYSRSFSNGIGTVLVNGQKTNTVGLICMDLLMIDITNINANVGDIVTLLGKDGKEEISLYELANKSSTITIEVLNHFGERLKKIYFE